MLLGLLDPDYFLGGDMPLDADRAATARSAGGRGRSGLPVDDTAAGVHDVVNQNMAAAARMHAVEQGVDLRGVTVLAFGGAGPVHACGVAELLDSDRVIFPVNASVLSAFGTLVTPVRIDLARSHGPRAGRHRRRRARRACSTSCATEGRRVLAAAGVPDDAVRFRYGLDARYARPGQRDHRSGSARATQWPADGDERGRAVRRGVPSASTA